MSTLRVYSPLVPRARFLHDTEDRKRLLFHVEHGDYFATLATILMLIKDQLDDAIRANTAPTRYSASVLQSMHDDLMHLAAEWKIVKKESKTKSAHPERDLT
jgi:hypothetical protein